MPRGAFSYLLNDRTNLRGGFGLFSYDYFFENINQAGFSQPTPVLVTTDNGLTFTGATLSNPIPSGQLVEPVGAALGLRSQLGQNLGTLFQPDREAAYYRRWEVTLQRDWTGGWVTSLTYIGSRGVNLPVVQQTNNIPKQYLSTSRSRDAAERNVPVGQRGESVCRPAARQHDQRRAGRALAAAPAVPRVRDVCDRELHRLRSLRRGDGAGGKALPERELADRAVHALVLARHAELSESAGRRARGPRLAQRSAESFFDRHQSAPAFWPARTLGQGLEPGGGRGAWRVAVERHVSVPGRVPAVVEQRLLRLVVRQPGVAGLAHRREGERRDRRPRRAGVGHEMFLFPRRGGADQWRRRSDEAARRPAHPAGQQRALFPVDVAQRAHRQPAPARRRPVQELRPAARHEAAVPHGGDQRAELHGVVEPGHESAQLHVRVHQPGSQQSAGLADRGAVYLLSARARS